MAPKAVSSTAMVALEFEIQNRTSSVKLDRTPDGWNCFQLVFYAAMSQPLRSLVQDHMLKGQLKPNDADQTLAYDVVWNGLIQRLEAEPDLITMLAKECDSGNGIQALSILRSKFAGNTPAKSLAVVNQMFEAKLDTDTVKGAQRIVALNGQLATDERFPEKLLAALVLNKLPSSFSNLRDGAITGGAFPAVSSLLDQIEQLAPFVVTPSVNLMHRGGILCFNCDQRGHPVSECKQTKVDCDICGPKAGHLPHHCLAKNGKDMPVNFSAAQREKILRLRAEFEKSKKSINNAEMVPAEADESEPIVISYGGALADPPQLI